MHFSLFVLCRWDAGSVVHLAAMFKDVPMTQDELQFVIEKLLRLLGELDLQELPPLVYQLLILASKVSQLKCSRTVDIPLPHSVKKIAWVDITDSHGLFRQSFNGTRTGNWSGTGNNGSLYIILISSHCK